MVNYQVTDEDILQQQIVDIGSEIYHLEQSIILWRRRRATLRDKLHVIRAEKNGIVDYKDFPAVI